LSIAIALLVHQDIHGLKIENRQSKIPNSSY
jgi:hypothetical protein